MLPSIEERREMTSFAVEDAMRTDGVLVAEPGEHIVGGCAACGGAIRMRRCCCACVRGSGGCSIAKMCCGWLRTRRGTTTPIHAKSKGPVPYLFRDQSSGRSSASDGRLAGAAGGQPR